MKVNHTDPVGFCTWTKSNWPSNGCCRGQWGESFRAFLLQDLQTAAASVLIHSLQSRPPAGSWRPSSRLQPGGKHTDTYTLQSVHRKKKNTLNNTDWWLADTLDGLVILTISNKKHLHSEIRYHRRYKNISSHSREMSYGVSYSCGGIKMYYPYLLSSQDMLLVRFLAMLMRISPCL